MWPFKRDLLPEAPEWMKAIVKAKYDIADLDRLVEARGLDVYRRIFELEKRIEALESDGKD